MFETFNEKVKAIKAVVTGIEKQFGKGSLMALGDVDEMEPVEALPTGSTGLDLALGVGGYPRGRVIEVYGPEASGKTTLTLHAIAEAQRAGGIAAFIDAEHALDVNYARQLGVDTEKLLVSQPDTGEQALEIAEAIVRSGAVDLVVIDSVAALVPKAEIEGEMGDQHMGLQARLMSQALRKLTAVTHRTQTTLIFINQLRNKIGVVFGNPETTTGGNALKFYASVRLDVRRIATVKSGEEKLGSRTRVKVVKNKCATTTRQSDRTGRSSRRTSRRPPDRRGRLRRRAHVARAGRSPPGTRPRPSTLADAPTRLLRARVVEVGSTASPRSSARRSRAPRARTPKGAPMLPRDPRLAPSTGVGPLVEVFRGRFPCRASASLVVTTARALGLDVEVREGGDAGVLVVVEGLRADRPAGERLAMLSAGAT